MSELIEEYLGGYRWLGYWEDSGKAGWIKSYSEEDTIRFIEKYSGEYNLGITMVTYVDSMPRLLYLPFDFDSEDNIMDAYKDAKKLFDYVVRLGYYVLMTYSGCKGFHVFIKTIPNVYTKSQINYLQYHFKNLLGLETQDPKIMGQFKRLLRIPETYHIKGNMDEVMYIHEGRLLDLSKIIDFKYKFNPRDFETDGSTEGLVVNHEYPCVAHYLADREYWKKNHPRHTFQPVQILRFAFAIEELAKGKSVSEVTDEMEKFGWSDFDRGYTEYQVSHIKGNKYIHPSCDTLKRLGFCDDSCNHFDELLMKYVKKGKNRKVEEED